MVGHDDQLVHNETFPARMNQDTEDEDKIVSVLHRLKVFAPDTSCDVVQNIATKDSATADIQESLLQF